MASWFSKHARGESDDAGSRRKTPAGTASPPRGPLMLALEPRMMFDASVAVVADAAAEATHDAVTAAAGSTARPHDANVVEGSGATAAGTADDQTGGTSGSGHDRPTGSATDASGADTPARADTTAATITSLATLGADALQLGKSDAGTAIVVIDASVDEPDTIVAALPAGTEVIRLNADSDGLAQLSAALAGRGGIGSIQLVTEGTTAALRLGNTWVDRTALDARSTQLAAIGAALAADGDILVYGCKTADGADGRAFIDEFARLTGADVAASTDWTGAASLGGNWTLEYANGDINHGQLLDATSAAGYDHLLNTLAAGDIVIIGWGRTNPVNQGEVYLMSLVDVPAGTTIALTDLGWDNSTGAFQASPNTSEGRLVWTLGSTLQAGDVVKVLIYPSSGGATITNITDGTTISAGDYATSGWSSSTYVFNANGDGVFIYQDSPTNPYFIFGVNTSQGGSPYTVDSSGWNQQVSSNGDALSMLPNGTGSQNALVNGSTAVGFPQQSLNNNLQYNGSTVGTDRAGWLARITDRNNWNGVDLTATETATNSIGTTTGSFGLITAPNHTPTLSLDSGSTSYTENGSAIVVSGGATASDTDGNWNGGTVRLSLGSNGSATDVLGIGASGGISVSGTTVSYGGTAIGTLSAATGSLSGSTVTGSASSALLVTLNGSATDAAVQALVRAFTFANSSDDPGSGTRTVMVAVADALNASASASRSITVTPTNDAPTDITLSNTTVAENSSTPATVGTLGTTDPDSGNTFTYTIVGGADQASFDISGGTLRFASGATLDYETQNSYSVTVRSTDQGGLSTDKTFTVTLSNVNDGPTRVSLSSSGLDASTATANATVGTLTATDPDAGDTLTFSLALGNGSNDADNGLFTISGNTLRVGAGGLAAGTYHVMARATDSGGYYVNQALVITIATPNVAPTLVLDNGNASFTENGSAIAVSGGATVSDAESNWNGGSVTLALTANGNSSDVLALDTSGSVALAGTTVSVGGTAVGTLSAGSGTLSGATVSGSGTASLVVTLNASATDADVQAIVRALTFGNSGDNPGGATRTLSVTVADNAAGSSTQTRDITVTPVNDAPTASGGSYSLPSTDEDTASTPVTVASLLGNFTTADADGDTLGIAITAASGNGHWQYSTDGASWTNVGSASASAAVLLDATTRLRYVGDGVHGETVTRPSVSFVAWDGSTGSASVNGTPATADTGASTAFSTGTLTADISVAEVNDAPVLADTTLTLTVEEDSGAPVGAVGSSLADFMGGVSDIDDDTPLGVAISSADEALGTWYYTTDGGGSWNALGAVSESSALLLANDGSTRLFFQTSAGVTGTTPAALGLHAWDGTEGSAGSRADLTGGSSAYSQDSDTVSVTVTESPKAPVLTPTAPAFTGITEDDSANAGQTVADLLGSSVTDGNTGAVQGIAITGLDAGNGSWEYSLDGTTWTAVGGVSDSAALLLRASDHLRFVPDGINADSASLTYRAWDQSGATAGLEGTTANTTTHGGRTAFSTATDTATLAVSDVNDAPTLATTTLTLTGTDEDTSVSYAVADLLADAGLADADSGALGGIAVTALTGNGSWEFSTDSGGTWTAVGSVSASSAALFTSATQLRYTPDGNRGETAGLSFAAWDRSSGSASAGATVNTADTTTRGGTTAFSTATAGASLAVSDVNDAPVVTVPGSLTVTEDVSAALTGISVGDADAAGGGNWLVTLHVDSGTLHGVSGFGVIANGDGTDTITLLAPLGDINGFLAAGRVSFTTAADATADVTLTVSADDNGNNGSGGALTDSDSTTIHVTPVNDAPVLTDTTLTLTVEEDSGAPVGAVGSSLADFMGGVSDIDGDTPLGVAIGSADEALGTWYYTTDGGGSWNALGAVSESSALLLANDSSTRLFFQTSAGVTGTTSAALGLHAWDGTEGSAGSRADLTGGSSAYSHDSDTVSVTVTESPKAPVLTPTAPAFTGITEDDSANAGQTVADLLGSSVTDGNTGAVQGIAITGLDAGNGSWEYSLDGTTWTAVGGVSDSAALLLRATDHLRFVPDGINADSASLTYRAWDQSGATAGLEGTTADTTAHGGRTAFSTATDTATLAVSDVNDAPTLATTTLTLTGTDEDTSVTYAVADLLADAGLADADSGALGGIAVTALSGNGSWEFSTDSGGTWTAVDSVSASSAALFTSTTQLRYVPDGNRGETAGLSFAAWDRSSGSASSGATVNTADTTTRGGTTAFSTATASASLAVSDVNDAPTLATTTLTLAGTDEDTASAAITVADLLADAGLADADSGALGGIAVTALGGNGGWEFSTDGGSTWTAVGGVSTSSAALFTSATQLRYTPDGLHGETASLGFAAWDRTTGSASATGSVSHADASTRGGSTAFSADLASASLTVGEVNDLPTLATSAGSAVFTEAGGAVVIDSGITLADIDGQPAIVSATVAITSGRAAGDVLGFANDGATMGDIAASWDAGSGRLTLSSTGGATLAQWQAALRAVSFDNGSALVADGARTVSFSVTDAGGDSSAGASRAIGVSAIDQPASLGNLPDASTYTEGDAPTVLAPDLTVLDPESAEAGFDGASVTLVNHAGADARDLFSATGTLGPLTEGRALVVDGVTVGSVSRNSGGLLVLDFSGANATLANVQAVLRQIGYSNASDAPPASATLDWRFTPASGADATGATDISLVPVNDTTAFAGGGGTTAIDDTGSTAPFASLVVADPDTQGATVSVTLGDALGAGDFTAGTSGWTRSVSGNDIIWTRTFASTDNIGGTIQAALRDLVFTPAANAPPSGTTRAIGFGVTVDDGGGTPVSVNATTLTVSPVNDAPVLDGDSSFALPSTDENTPSIVSVADLLAGAGARDVDAGTALGLAITFTSGRGQWQYSTDSGATWHAVGAVSADAALTLGQYGLLRYTPDGIEADLASINFVAWDASAGTLTDGATRGTVDAGAPAADGATSATTTGATLSVTDVNDAPTLVVPDRLSLDEDGSVVITGIELRDVDGDLIVTIASGGATPLAVMVPGPVSVSFSVPGGTLAAAPGEGVTITTAADGTVTLTGQLNTLNAWLAAGNLSYTAAPNANGEVALSVRFDDGGNIGGGSLVATAEVVLDIAAVNDAPTVTAPADADVGEGLSVSFGSATGNAITLADIDAGSGLLRLTLTATHGTLTLGSLAGISFISGDGRADASLVIEGNLAALRSALDGLVFSPAAGYHGAASIGLVLSDLGNSGSGGALVADTSIDLDVIAAPRATGVSLVGDDNGYKAGDTVLIEVDYDSALVLDTTGGSPTLALNVGGTTRLATLVSSDGGRLVFGYTVLAGDSTVDLALAGGNALSLNGATLRNATGSNAVLALPTPSGSGPLDGGTPVVVDGIAPVVTSVTLPADGLYAAGDTLDFTVNLSEAVTLDTSAGTPRIAVSIGGTTVYATYVGGSGGSALGFRLVLPAGVSGDGISLAGNLDFNGATVRDALGNPADPALHGVGTAAITIDGQVPTAGTPATGTAGPTNATSLDFTVVFDEAVSGVDAADFTVRATGSASGSITGVRSTDGGKTWIVTVAAGGDGTLAVDLDASGTGITDAAGNAVSGGATGTPVAVDHGLPTVDGVTLLDAQTNGADTLRFQIRFSEDVNGLDPADLALVLGDSATGRITGLTQVDARTWVVTVGNVAGNGSVALSLVAAGSGIADAAGNTLAADATSPAYTHTESVVPIAPAPAPAPVPAPQPVPALSSLAPVVLPAAMLPGNQGSDPLTPLPIPAPVPAPAQTTPVAGLGSLSVNPALDQPLAARPFSGSFSLGAGRAVSFGIPDGSFVVRDAQAHLTLSARQLNGQPLPAWLRFDPATSRFSGTVPPGVTGRLRLQVLLRDDQGHVVSTEIDISLGGSPRAALPAAEADRLALAALLGDLAGPSADRAAPAPDHDTAAGRAKVPASTLAPVTASAARAPFSDQLDRHGDAGFADELAALLGAVTRL